MAKQQARKSSKELPQPERHAQPAHYGSGIDMSSRGEALPRPSGHARTESYQPEGGSRSQANSPVKARPTQEERYRKTKSMAI